MRRGWVGWAKGYKLRMPASGAWGAGERRLGCVSVARRKLKGSGVRWALSRLRPLPPCRPQEGAVKLWDLRMGGGSGTPRGQTGTHAGLDDSPSLLPSLVSGATIPLCLGSFRVGAEGPSPAAGLAMYGQQACICYSGASLGVINLTPGSGSSRSRVGVTRLLGLGGAPLGAAIRGLSILPLSRLLVVGTEDGWLRICK